MEDANSIDNNIINNIEKSDEFQIIKNNIIYNIKLSSINDDSKNERIKIAISFILNQKFNIYEEYLDSSIDLKSIENISEVYQIIKNEIENNKIEIIHPIEENNEYIILKIDIDNGIKEIKLIQTNHNDIAKLNELIKNYKTLEDKYIQLKKEKENNKMIKTFNNSDSDDSYNIVDDNDTESIKDNQIAYENSDENHIIINTSSKIWCMLELNNIDYVENKEEINLHLATLGLMNAKIILINLNNMKIYQEIKTPSIPYSLAKFNDDSKSFIASFSNGKMIIYKLKDNKFETYQLLEKPLKKGEINKVITLSDGNIATAERGALSIWKPKIEKGEKKFELYKEIITYNDTCQLLEVNPGVFACAIYNSKLINVYKNDGNEYPLLGIVTNVESHGSNSNGMAKINDKIFCSGGNKRFLYIVSVEPVQIIQKINLGLGSDDEFGIIRFICNSNDGFIFTSPEDEIIQYKIVCDKNGNFIKLEVFDIIKDSYNNSAILTTSNGRILYKQKNENMDNKINLYLTKYKKLDS